MAFRFHDMIIYARWQEENSEKFNLISIVWQEAHENVLQQAHIFE